MQTAFELFMTGHNTIVAGWAMFAVLAAVFGAAFYLVSQLYRQPAHSLMFWMRVLIVVTMTPRIMRLEVPHNPLFYVYVAVTAVLAVCGDVRVMNVARIYGAGVAARLMPMVVWGSFLLWLVITPARIQDYISAPLQSLGIMAALTGCVYFSMRLNRCTIARAAYRQMIPVLVAYTFLNVMNKLAMTEGRIGDSFTVAVYVYMYVQSVVAVVLLAGYCWWRGWRDRKIDVAPPPRLLPAVIAVTLCWFGHVILKNYAMAYVPNPSYVVALNLTTPVFVSLAYLTVRHREESDVFSGMGIVVSAVFLALFAL